MTRGPGLAIGLLAVALLLVGGAEGASPPAGPGAGGLIAFVSERNGGPDVFVMRADGSRQQDLTPNTVNNNVPAWSPDGKRIAFTSSRDGNREVYVMAADGSGQHRLTHNPAGDYHPAWQPVPGRRG